MASIIKEITIETSAEHAWDALRDVGALHTRLVCGFVVDTVLEGDSRIVTFANGMVVRENIVTIDEGARRLAYTNELEGATFHAASAQVFDGNGDGSCRVVWITDVLPEALAAPIDSMMSAGIAAMKQTLEAVPVTRP
jgi:hypothetical protein